MKRYQEGWVYFIRKETPGDPARDLVKIGWSRDPEHRLATLQRLHEAPLVLVAVFPGTRATERCLHALFAAARTDGEWFTPCDGIERILLSDTLPVLDVPEIVTGLRRRPLSIYLPPDDGAEVLRRLRSLAVGTGRSLSEVVCAAIREFVGLPQPPR